MSASPATAATPPVSPTAPAGHIEGHVRRSIGVLAARNGLGIAINLAGTVVLSRLLGPEPWGALAIAQLIYLGSQEVLGRGVSTYLIKKEDHPTSADIGHSLALQQLLGLVLLGAAAALARPAAHWYRHPGLAPLMYASGLAAYGCAWRSVPLSLLERDFAYFKVALVEVLDTLIFNSVAIALAWNGHGIAALTWAMVLRSLLPAALAVALRPLRPQIALFDRALLPATDFGLSAAALSLANIAMMSVPAVVVGRLAGMAALGLAQMAFGLYANFLFVTAAILRLAFSAYSRLTAFPEELHRLVCHHLEVLAAALVPAIVLFAGFAPLWAPLIFGAKWSGLPLLLLVLAPGYLFAAVFWGVLNPALMVSGKHRHLVLWLIAFTASYAFLTWKTTPSWPALGVAIAFSVVEITLHPALFWMYRNLYGPIPYKRVFTELALGAAFLALLWPASSYHALAAALPACLYLGLCYLRNRNLLAGVRRFAQA